MSIKYKDNHIVRPLISVPQLQQFIAHGLFLCSSFHCFLFPIWSVLKQVISPINISECDSKNIKTIPNIKQFEMASFMWEKCKTCEWCLISGMHVKLRIHMTPHIGLLPSSFSINCCFYCLVFGGLYLHKI